jgi:hypothetical protein
VEALRAGGRHAGAARAGQSAGFCIKILSLPFVTGYVIRCVQFSTEAWTSVVEKALLARGDLIELAPERRPHARRAATNAVTAISQLWDQFQEVEDVMEQEFDRASACEQFLAKELGLDLARPDDQGMLRAFVDLSERPAPDAGGFEVRFGRWVVRLDDLGIFAAIRNAVVLGLAGHYWGGPTVAVPASAITAFAEMLWNVSRALGHVTPRQARILGLMGKFGGTVTADDLYSQPTEDGDLEWTKEKIVEELGHLQQVVTRGGVQKMVEKLADGRWVLNGV